MTEDEKKILAHILSRRKKWVSKDEISSAWQFEDFDAAVLSLIDKKLISTMSTTIGLTKKGKEVLKEM